jgi:ATP-dependent helicase HrpB
LPVAEALPALRQALAARGTAVLEAPPGAGKSTVVPLALLDEPWVRGKRLIMLEPRRLAARAIAQRLAQSLGEAVGQTVGYRMRLDTRVSGATRLEVVTEGVLTRMLQDDPALEGVAGLLFDEFHERSLQADLGLALSLDARAQLAPELRLLVMSATLDGAAVARLLGEAPRVSLPGRLYPVETRFAGRGPPALPGAQSGGGDPPEKIVARLTLRALREETGDVLVFLPGAREIRRVGELLGADALGPGVRVVPLYGDLAGEQQDAALVPAAPGTRKVVLATNIAETSLTIPGVRVVVDSGLARRALFDPATGMSALVTRRISRASAEQRQGRAGRLGPGVCYRAWSEGAHASLAPFTPPEIVEADLAPLALELASWGARDAGTLAWLDRPPAAMLAAAAALLERLGALAADGRISAHGRRMARLGVHPRLAHLLLRARELGSTTLGAQLAALLTERDLVRGAAAGTDADIRTRVALLRGEEARAGVDRSALERVRRVAQDLKRQLAQLPGEHGTGGAPRGGRDGARDARRDPDRDVGLLLALAYPDRIGRRRGTQGAGFTLSNGRGAAFVAAQALARREFIVAVDLDLGQAHAHTHGLGDARILLAAPLERADLMEQFTARIRRLDAVAWSTREQAVLARRTLELDALVLEEQPLADAPAEALRAAMLAGVRELGLAALPWDREARDLQARIEFLRAAPARSGVPPWPAVADGALAGSLESWLAPWLDGVTRREHLARLPLEKALRALLSFEQQRALDERAPAQLVMPSGSRVRVDYRGDDAPAVAVRLQEVFGLAATPRIDGGRVPVTLRLLSPAQRPVQVTRDLTSFWRSAYLEVRKDLRGRYPKHYWPEDPLAARPTRGVRRPR